MEQQTVLELLHQGGLTVYPLAFGSFLALFIFFERLWRFRGIAEGTRKLTRDTVDALVQRDLVKAQRLCEDSKQPIASVYLEALKWKNVALDDLERVLSTSRQEAAFDLKRGLWMVGTVGSLAPYVGLFGTVVGIIRAFQAMAIEGVGGFEVVASGISEALIATAAGLAVAIIALVFFNYLQTRVGALAAIYARSCERFVQALLFVESSTEDGEVPSGSFVPAG